MAGPSPVQWGHRRPAGMGDAPIEGAVMAPHHGLALSRLPEHQAAVARELADLGLAQAPRFNFIAGAMIRAARP